MFTGLVEMTGVLVNLHGEHLTLRPSKPFAARASRSTAAA